MVDIAEMVADVQRGMIPAGAYSDPDVFALEVEHLFARAWVFLAHESEIPNPGDYLVRRVVADSFLVTRTCPTTSATSPSTSTSTPARATRGSSCTGGRSRRGPTTSSTSSRRCSSSAVAATSVRPSWWPPHTSLEHFDDEAIGPAFDEIFHANVASQLLSVKAALGPLRAARGSVVLTVSTSGFYAGRGGVLYVASKFAVRGLVLALARELAPAVRVNGVAPGGTLATDLRGPETLDLAGRRLADAPDREADLRARSPLELALSPEDHAGSYVFLASDRSRGMTGTFLHPDGGQAVR